MNIIFTLEELKNTLYRILDSSDFQLTRVNFDQQEDWEINNGALCHKSKGFFCITGLKDADLQKEYLILFQPQSAFTGILITVIDNEIFLLVQARIEPGNTGIIQLGPTVQSTPANFLRLHGGKSTPYLDLLYGINNNVISFNSTNHLDLGKTYYQKTKWLNYALVNDLVETEGSFVWAPLKVLAEAAEEDYLLNTDLRSLLAVYDWDYLINPEINLNYEISNILKHFLLKKDFIKCHNNFVQIDKSNKFRITNHGIFSKEEDALEIGMYKVKTKHREVNHWFQPLWGAKSKGLVLLLCRTDENKLDFEYLLSVKKEIGISGHYSIAPSYLIYPNEHVSSELNQVGQTLYKYTQSDEGGRFINHEYLFRIAEVHKDIPITEHQFWVSSEELKKILSMSNLASIQLRNICSVLIKNLNKKYFI